MARAHPGPAATLAACLHRSERALIRVPSAANSSKTLTGMRSINVAGRFSDRRKRMLAQKIDVERIEWPRPRQSVIALVGEQKSVLTLVGVGGGKRLPSSNQD